jgi:hypothetical protein
VRVVTGETLRKKKKQREEGFTEEEATAILVATFAIRWPRITEMPGSRRPTGRS